MKETELRKMIREELKSSVVNEAEPTAMKQLDAKKTLVNIKKFSKQFGDGAVDVRKYPSIGTIAMVDIGKGEKKASPEQLKKHKGMLATIKKLKLPMSKLDSVGGEARFWVQYHIQEGSVTEAKNPFKKGNKIIVDKTFSGFGGAKKFEGKKGIVNSTQDDYVFVKLKNFKSPSIEFHMKELKLDEALNEAFWRVTKDGENALYVLTTTAQTLLDKVSKGDDYDPRYVKIIEDKLKDLKKNAKKFNKKEDVMGTAFEGKRTKSVNEGFEKSAIQKALKDNGYDLKQSDVKMGQKKESGGFIMYTLNGVVIGSNDYGYKELIQIATEKIKKDPKKYGLKESVNEAKSTDWEVTYDANNIAGKKIKKGTKVKVKARNAEEAHKKASKKLGLGDHYQALKGRAKNLGESINEVDKPVIKSKEGLKTWWKHPKEDLMGFIYWTKKQVPPSNKSAYDKQWKLIVKQLHDKFPAPVSDYKRKIKEKKESNG